MKVKVDVDLTPEEARKLMGLPEIEPMQQRILAQMEKQLSSNLSYMDPEVVMRTIMPVGAQGMEKLQDLLWGVAGAAMGKGGRKTDSKKKAD